MEVLLLLAMVAVAASALYVAATFNKRTRQNAAPLMSETVEQISRKIDQAGEELRRYLTRIGEDSQHRLANISDQMKGHGELATTRSRELRTLLTQTSGQLSDLAGQLAAGLASVTRIAEQIEARQAQMGRDLQQTGQRVIQTGESLSQQTATLLATAQVVRHIEELNVASIRDTGKSLGQITANQADAGDKLAGIIRILDQHTETGGRLEQFDRWATTQMADTLQHFDTALRRQRDIRDYLHSWLEFETERADQDHTCRIIAATLSLSGPGADIVWPLLRAFCETMDLRVLPPETRSSTRYECYLLWNQPGGRPLEELLTTTLAACPDRSAVPVAGLDELRGLLLALHMTGLGTIEIGPMIVNRTRTALTGYVTTAAEAARIRRAGTAASPDACEAALRTIAQDRPVELTAWADASASSS